MARDKAKRRRRSTTVTVLNGLLTVVVIGLLIAGGVFVYALHLFYEDNGTTEPAAFLIEKGNGVSAIAKRLEDQHLISNGLLFGLGFKYLSHDATLLPGQYMLPAGASIADVIELLATTKPREFFVNVIPGESSWQVASDLNSPAQSLAGDILTPPVEGSLLAVRHDYFPGDTRQALLEKMQKAMADKVAEIWNNRDPSIDDVITSPADLVTMASLVEKETGLGSERPEVASVFINRLRKHMRLQTDPSVIYGITLGRAKLERGLTTKDLASKSPYNTYQIDGLPAGPIANPGEEALMAVAHPADTKFLYFVARTADPADGHLFAATYKEHRSNVAKYRKAAAADEAENAKEALEAQQASAAGDTSQ